MIIYNFLEDSFKFIIDCVEFFGFCQMNDQSWLESAVVGCIVSLLVNLNGLGLESSDGDVLVLQQALGDETDGQVALIVNSVKLDGLKLSFEKLLGLDDKSLEFHIAANDDDVVSPRLGLVDFLLFFFEKDPFCF